jgi:hypothetical protein
MEQHTKNKKQGEDRHHPGICQGFLKRNIQKSAL